MICEPDLLDNDRYEPDIPKLPATVKRNRTEVIVEEEEKVIEEPNSGMMDFSQL